MAGSRILLFEGSDIAHTEVVDALERDGDGFEIERVPDLEAAGPIDELAVDCVLVGNGFTDEAAVEIIRTIRETDPLLPIVLYAESGSETLASEAISAGVSEYVQADAHDDPGSILASRIEALLTEYRSQRRTRREQQRAEQYFELAGNIMVALDPEGRIERINDQGAEILGYESAELIGRNWFEVVIPEPDREETEAAFEGLLQGEVEEYGVVRNDVRTRSGEYLTIEWKNNVIRDESGTPIGTLSAGRDVTEQLAQTEAIEAERDRFLALFENIPEPAIVSSFEDSVPIVRQVNRAFERVFGFDAETIIGENIDSFIVPPGDSGLAKDLNQELVEGNSVQEEVTRLTATGVREFRLHVVPLKPGTENVEGYAIYEDITDIKHRQRVLEGLHDAATDIVAAETAREVCERTVEAAAEILQFDLCEISLEEDGTLVSVASSEEIDADVPTAVSVEEGLAGKTYRTGESFLVGELESNEDAIPQGSWSSAISVPIGTHGVFQAVAAEGDAFEETDLELAELLISHVAETLTRIEKASALRDREEVLREQNERLERFTSVLSHDLRNPLNVASGELDLARETIDDPRLEKVAQAHTRMRELVEDMLILARSEEQISDPEPIDLRRTLEVCFGNVETESAALQIETEQVVLGDPSRVASLFENLFRNAVEHGGDGVAITVGATSDGFFVSDDGPGIPEEERESVLEAGFSTGDSGTGLGLNIVAETVEAHGWEMTITESESGGARFEISGVEIVDEAETGV